MGEEKNEPQDRKAGLAGAAQRAHEQDEEPREPAELLFHDQHHGGRVLLPPEGFRAHIFSNRFSQNLQQKKNAGKFQQFFHISLKYSNLGIPPVKNH